MEKSRVGAGLYPVNQMNAMAVDAIDPWLHRFISNHDIDNIRSAFVFYGKNFSCTCDFSLGKRHEMQVHIFVF